MNVDALRIRLVLGRQQWSAPRAHGPDGWWLRRYDATATIIVTCADHDGDDWIHASIAHPDTMPTYDELKLLHQAVYGDGWAYQVFAPPSDHVNIHSYALHLFGRLDGKPVLPDFTSGMGSI